MLPADNRRIAGWRLLREYLNGSGSTPFLRICNECKELIRSLPALLCDAKQIEDASGEPHNITHAPEALRYALMSRCSPPDVQEYESFSFKFKKPKGFLD